MIVAWLIARTDMPGGKKVTVQFNPETLKLDPQNGRRQVDIARLHGVSVLADVMREEPHGPDPVRDREELAETFVIARESSDTVDLVEVEIRHDGLVGYGEGMSWATAVAGRTLTSAHGGVYELGIRERDHGIPVAPFPDP